MEIVISSNTRHKRPQKPLHSYNCEVHRGFTILNRPGYRGGPLV